MQVLEKCFNIPLHCLILCYFRILGFMFEGGHISCFFSCFCWLRSEIDGGQARRLDQSLVLILFTDVKLDGGW